MKFLKSVINFYQYIYYRFYLFSVKSWAGNDKLALSSTNYGMAYSSGSLFIIIDLLIKNYTDYGFLFDSFYQYIIIFILIFLIQSYILREDIESLEKKFGDVYEDKSMWQVKGYLSLLFVFAPMIAMIFLM